MLFQIALMAAVFGSPVCYAGIPTAWEGDYAGWGYESPDAGGSDLPLRMHVRASGDAGLAVVTVDVPSGRAFGLPGEKVRADGPRLTFQRTSSKGVLWAYDLTRDGDDFRGALEIGGTTLYRVQLHKSARPLASPPVERTGAVGCYRFDDGGTLWISAQPWGELRYFASGTARQGTLFSVGGDEFFAGAADYVPSVMDAEVRIPVAANAQVSEIEWKNTGQPAARARRITIEEREIVAPSGDATIRGTLLLPPGAGDKSAVVVVGGSDWAVRSSTLQDARFFLSMGMAALVYDRRGCGKSSGEDLCTFAQSAEDAMAMVNAVRAQPGIRKDVVGLAGRSRGGWTAPLAASRGDAAFVVMLSGAAVTPMQTQTTNRLNQMREAGFDGKPLEEGRKYLSLLWASEKSEEAWAHYAAARERIIDRGWWKYLSGPDTRDSYVYRWQLLNYRYEPREALAHLRCPLLAIYGEFDDNITPEENVPALKEATADLPRGQVTIVVLKGADHGLRRHEPDPIQRNRLHLLRGWVPEYPTTVRNWLTSNGLAPGTDEAPGSRSASPETGK